MATTLQNIKRRPGDALAGPTPTIDESALLLGTCGACEQTLFLGFREAAPDDESVWKSPDRLTREREETKRPEAFRCRHCKHVIEPPPRSGARIRRVQ